MRRTAIGILVATVASVTLAAQIGGKPVSGGNPTPGTPQPAPPNLRDRMTVAGCLQRVAAATVTTGKAATAEASPADTDPNTPRDDRFVLANAQRVERVPPDTGGSNLTRNASASTYRLEGLDSQFSPFVDMKVEISGELKPRTSTTTAAQILLVEFVQKIASRC